jgi:type III restriction enzyme
MQKVIFTVAKRTLDNHFRDTEGGERPWLFPQLLRITRDWIAQCVTPYKEPGTFEQMLLFAEYSHAAAERIERAIYSGTKGEKRLMPILHGYEPFGSTDGVWFQTTKPCHGAGRSHVNLVVVDSGWEAQVAQILDSIPEVLAYVKNQGLDFKIPYAYEGRAANYIPDFLVRLRDKASSGDDDLLTVIIEVTGQIRKEKVAKVANAKSVWVEAVNNWGGAGRWGFIEVHEPWEAGHLLRRDYLEGTLIDG